MAARAVDGNKSTDVRQGSCSVTHQETNPWWSVTLDQPSWIQRIRVTSGDHYQGTALTGFDVIVDGVTCSSDVHITDAASKVVECDVTGQEIMIVLRKDNTSLVLCEVEVQILNVEDKTHSCDMGGELVGTLLNVSGSLSSVPDASACQELCKSTARCAYWNYNKVLKVCKSYADKTSDKLIKNPDIISGDTACHLTNLTGLCISGNDPGQTGAQVELADCDTMDVKQMWDLQIVHKGLIRAAPNELPDTRYVQVGHGWCTNAAEIRIGGDDKQWTGASVANFGDSVACETNCSADTSCIGYMTKDYEFCTLLFITDDNAEDGLYLNPHTSTFVNAKGGIQHADNEHHYYCFKKVLGYRAEDVNLCLDAVDRDASTPPERLLQCCDQGNIDPPTPAAYWRSWLTQRVVPDWCKKTWSDQTCIAGFTGGGSLRSLPGSLAMPVGQAVKTAARQLGKLALELAPEAGILASASLSEHGSGNSSSRHTASFLELGASEDAASLSKSGGSGEVPLRDLNDEEKCDVCKRCRDTGCEYWAEDQQQIATVPVIGAACMVMGDMLDQRWEQHVSTGQIKEEFGKCLFSDHENTPGAHLDMYNCSKWATDHHQIWNWDQTTGQIKSRYGPVLYQTGYYGYDYTAKNIFNHVFREGPGIICRDCKSCDVDHRHICYKRLTDPGVFDAYDQMLVMWSSENNTFNVDFELYSTVVDAVMGRRKWNSCTTFNIEGVGFPGDCGRDAPSENQWNSFVKVTSYTLLMEKYAGATTSNAVAGASTQTQSCGATDLDTLAERQKTSITLDECHQWCSVTPNCCAVVFSHFGGICMRRSNCDTYFFCQDSQYDTYLRSDVVVTYISHMGKTAIAGGGGDSCGATPIGTDIAEGSKVENMNSVECQARCTVTPICCAVVHNPTTGLCVRMKDCKKTFVDDLCDAPSGTGDTYTKQEDWGQSSVRYYIPAIGSQQVGIQETEMCLHSYNRPAVIGANQNVTLTLETCNITDVNQKWQWQFRGPIKNVYGICLKALAETVPGSGVQMQECDLQNTHEQWTWAESTGLIREAYGLCLEAAEPRLLGSSILMQNCNSSNLFQQWSYNEESGQIHHKHGICLDAPDGMKPNGTVRMWSCDRTGFNQHQSFWLER
eukprot:gnl/MRDRNA2_/MRDRNA2_58510_c0_seq1.p1 gnl/MRDRNA2_/MRDRNA2_58510_c0~~gnl/MRDRNA2_/MRDRNA2_58510_c0_seq1.p1  ORF type:complete len:1197 (-),score=158.22 gnl/MRDRNA2_/MRDRNA2_58510_c0_seq1:96-3488(-)